MFALPIFFFPFLLGYWLLLVRYFKHVVLQSVRTIYSSLNAKSANPGLYQKQLHQVVFPTYRCQDAEGLDTAAYSRKKLETKQISAN